MHFPTKRTSLPAVAALALVVGVAPAAVADGHLETVVAFDPEAGQLSEGVAVDADGNVYASLSPLGQLVRVGSGDGGTESVASLEGLAEGDFGLIGLTSYEGDVYGGVFSANPELNGVWQFDVDSGAATRVSGTEAVALPNDVAFADDGTMYVSDTIGGAVWRVPAGGSAEAWISDDLLLGTGEAGFPFPLGANGIDVHDGTVYVGVTETAQIVTVPIAEDGSAGAATTLVQHEAAIDGVAVDEAGNVFATHPLANLITKLTPDGSVEVIATVDDGLDAPSSVELATGADGGQVAYIANFSIAMGGPLGAGPSILAIDLGAAE